MALNFAIIGASGFVAPRHLKAIRDTGNTLVAATDPHDSVGVLDQYSLGARFFPEIERFDRHLEKLRRGPSEDRVHYVTICSPNYLHDAHVRLALRIGAAAICEKPLVINPWNLDQVQALESESGCRVYSVLQLRLHPAVVELRRRLDEHPPTAAHQVVLTYITGRGPWYNVSWKGSVERSGGLGTNIGIHFFDLLVWLFGDVDRCLVHLNEPRRMGGTLVLRRAHVKWFLSVDPNDLPFPATPGRPLTHRSLTMDGTEVEMSDGFGDLHTRVYEEILAGRGHGIDVARPSIELAYRIRTAAVTPAPADGHPLLNRR
jgi:UDP-N-acetyl-2-amino-2-deoxyglucuronate dehydrogenase